MDRQSEDGKITLKNAMDQVNNRARNDIFSRFNIYSLQDGKLEIVVDELRDRVIDSHLIGLIPKNIFELGDEDENDEEQESLPCNENGELLKKKPYGKSEIVEQPQGNEHKESSLSDIEEKLTDKKLYGKNEIMELLQCGNQKALNFLKLLFQMEYAIKVGKKYLITKEEFERFFKDFKGQKIVI